MASGHINRSVRCGNFFSKMLYIPAFALALQISVGWAASVSVKTTSGVLHGTETNGRESRLALTRALGSHSNFSSQSRRSRGSHVPPISCPTNDLTMFQRFGQAPTGSLRWEPPVAFTSTASHNTMNFGPACVQQFPFAVAAINEQLFNTPPPPESED